MSVDVVRDGGVAVVTVNRPDAMNALDVEHAEALRDHLEDLAADPEARVVLLTGAGDKAFVAGADIKYMQSLGVLEARRWGELGQACANLLETIPKPTIAAINGYALGGGCELALACDIRIASREAKLGQPEVNLGIIPGWGGSQRLPRIVGLGFAKEIVFSGRAVEAQEAHDWGLVNQIYDPAELMPAAMTAGPRAGEEEPARPRVRQGGDQPLPDRRGERPHGDRAPPLRDALLLGGPERGHGRLRREARARVSGALGAAKPLLAWEGSPCTTR